MWFSPGGSSRAWGAHLHSSPQPPRPALSALFGYKCCQWCHSVVCGIFNTPRELPNWALEIIVPGTIFCLYAALATNHSFEGPAPTPHCPRHPQPPCMLCHVWALFAAPWTLSRQASLSMEFPRQEYWSGLPCPPSGVFPTQELNFCLWYLLLCQAGGFFTTHTTWEAPNLFLHKFSSFSKPFFRAATPVLSLHWTHISTHNFDVSSWSL